MRQSWFLPYAFAVCVLSLIVLGGLTVAVQTDNVQRRYIEEFQAAGQHQAAYMIESLGTSLLSELSFPIAVLAFLLLALATLSAWMLARRQERGSLAVLQAIEGLSMGRVRPPHWVSTDEVASSRISSAGSVRKARAMVTSCRSPAERFEPSSSIQVS